MEKCYGAYCKCSNCRYIVSYAGFMDISKEEYETLSDIELRKRIGDWCNGRALILNSKEPTNGKTERPGVSTQKKSKRIRRTERTTGSGERKTQKADREK